MLKKALFSIIYLTFAIAPGNAAAQEWQRIFDKPQLTAFVFLAGLFISISIWALLERQTIARRFRKILQAKAIG